MLADAAAPQETAREAAFASPKREDGCGDLIHRIAADKIVADDAVHGSAARVEQAQVIVNFGGGRYRRTRIARRVLLLDRDRRGEAVNQVDIGLLDALQELPRVRRHDST